MAAAIAVGSPVCSARPEACSGMWGHKYAKKSAAEAAPQKWVYVVKSSWLLYDISVNGRLEAPNALRK